MIEFRKIMLQRGNIRKDFSAIILAAGNSSRMGFPKFALKYSKTQTFLEHITEAYEKFGCAEIIVVVNVENYQYLQKQKIQFDEKIKFVVNEHPEWHRFYSLKKGVQALSKKIKIFVHNVDNPFVNPEVLMALKQNADKYDYIYPSFNGRGGHPFLLSENVVTDLKNKAENQIHLKEFLNQYDTKRIKILDERVLVNINTMVDYKKYFNWIE
jgi:CTP:molybdopterin cytidylyltransferase MocA